MLFSFVAPRASLGLLAGVLVLASACKKDSDTRVNADAALPATVKFVQPGLYPEGTQYDSQSGRFLVSSQTAGRIGQVTGDIAASDTSNTGAYTIFADNDQLISTIGLTSMPRATACWRPCPTSAITRSAAPPPRCANWPPWPFLTAAPVRWARLST